MNKKKCIIIGAGFGGLSSAILMAKEGYDVTVYEKNEIVGGRANLLEKDGFKRDMGPSRYLMPDVFEKFFQEIGENVSDYLDLVKLDPSYRVFFKNVPNTTNKDGTFERLENGSLRYHFSGGLKPKAEASSRNTRTVSCIIKHPTEEKFVMITRNGSNNFLFVGGGIEESEDLMSAAIREMIEETGYFDVKDCFVVVEKLYCDFFHATKKVNYLNCDSCVFIQLNSLAKQEVSKEEEKKHDIYRVDKEEVEKRIIGGDGQKFGWNRYLHWGEDLKIVDETYIQEVNSFMQKNDLMVDISPDLETNIKTFESMEPGAGKQLEKYLKSSEEQYQIAMDKFVYKNYTKWRQFLSLDILVKTWKLRIRKTMHQYVSRFFKSPELQKIMEYTMLFLGTSPYQAPALFNIMSHVDFGLGVYYPQGGIHEIPKALVKIAKKYGVKFETGTEVKKVEIKNNKIHGLRIQNNMIGDKENKNLDFISCDIIISNADMRHSETQLLEPRYQSYPESYRAKKVIAPSAYILYLGIKDKLPQLTHHNLIFAKDRNKGYKQIFNNPQLPDDPSLYICKPSEVDPSVAPEGHENLFVLVPLAPGLEIDDNQKSDYTNFILDQIAKDCQIADLKERVVVCETFTVKDFASKYNAYKGTALGLAHPLFQSALWRPDNKSKKLKGLYYAGGYTNPGIGMPMCLISGMLVAERIKSDCS